MRDLAALRLLPHHYRIKCLETCCHREQESKGSVGLGAHCYIYGSGLRLGKTVGLEHLLLGIWSCLAGLLSQCQCRLNSAAEHCYFVFVLQKYIGIIQQAQNQGSV